MEMFADKEEFLLVLFMHNEDHVLHQLLLVIQRAVPFKV